MDGDNRLRGEAEAIWLNEFFLSRKTQLPQGLREGMTLAPRGGSAATKLKLHSQTRSLSSGL